MDIIGHNMFTHKNVTDYVMYGNITMYGNGMTTLL